MMDRYCPPKKPDRISSHFLRLLLHLRKSLDSSRLLSHQKFAALLRRFEKPHPVSSKFYSM